jgi:hypothetical protein
MRFVDNIPSTPKTIGEEVSKYQSVPPEGRAGKVSKKNRFGFFKHLKDRFNALPKNRKIALVAGGGLLLLLVLTTIGYGIHSYIKWNRDDGQKRYHSTKDVTVEIGEPRDVESPINGVLYTQSQAEIFMKRRPLAIMVNNHTQARPQFGLAEADLIYEAVAEGGITRFLALFHAKDVEKVGPVRSARIYYEDWAAEFNAWYAHWGGAYMDDDDKANQDNPDYDFTCNPGADAYTKINRIGLPSLDQMWLGNSAYWRDNTRGVSTEHTGFTSTQKLLNEAPNRYPEEGWQNFEPFQTWLFKDDLKEADRPEAGSFEIYFWEGYTDYDVRWEYDPATNEYIRYQGGTKQIDAANNQEIRAKNVIVQFTDQSFFGDKKGHLKYETVGVGKAKVFLDGKIIDAEWNKPAIRERTRFFDVATGEEIKFNRGQIWIEIVPTGNEISYSSSEGAQQ